MSQPIVSRLLRLLDLQHPTSRKRAKHLSAASGLVQAGAHWYVVADDEHHLGVFAVDAAEPGHLIRLFKGRLPNRAKPRKREKPDLETLLRLPPFGDHPHGALLALGSGSRPNREAAVLLPLDVDGAIAQSPRLFDLSDLYTSLRERMGPLNIEGALVIGQTMRLLQRGNQMASNAVIDFPLAPFLGALAAPHASRPRLPLSIRDIDLGKVNGIALTFTDGAALPDGRMLFTAVAEDTENSYDDGACSASALGLLQADGKVSQLELLQGSPKVEGLVARATAKGIQVFMVTDGDDARFPAQLLTAQFPLR